MEEGGGRSVCRMTSNMVLPKLCSGSSWESGVGKVMSGPSWEAIWPLLHPDDMVQSRTSAEFRNEGSTYGPYGEPFFFLMQNLRESWGFRQYSVRCPQVYEGFWRDPCCYLREYEPNQTLQCAQLQHSDEGAFREAGFGYVGL